jgi:hypothetical protein
MIGSLYALTSLSVNLNESQPARRAILEPAVIMGLCLGLAVFIQ